MKNAIDIYSESRGKSLENQFLQEFFKQIQLHGSGRIYLDSSNLLEDFLSASSKRDSKSFNQDTDFLTQLKISAFYHAVAARIEKRTGKIAQTYINLSDRKISSALVFCGGVMVVSQMFWEIEKVSFTSLEHLVNEGEKLIQKAVGIAAQYFDCIPTNQNYLQLI